MRIRILLLVPFISIGILAAAQMIQKGPYTVYTLADRVYRIEDANEGNSPGIVLDADGKMVHMNNCSDMYLIVGENKALLIDLSNAVDWDNSGTLPSNKQSMQRGESSTR